MDTARRSALSFISVAAVSLASLGCGGEPAPASGAPGAAAPKATGGAAKPAPLAPAAAAAPATPSEKGPTVRVLDVGAEPRRALRYHVPSGSEQKVEMTLDVGAALVVGGKAGPPLRSPGAVLVFGTTTGPTSAPSGKDLRLDLVLKDIHTVPGQDASPEAAQAMLGALGPGHTFHGYYVFSEAGLQREMKFEADPDAPARWILERIAKALEGMPNHLTPPFPEAPVGVGARWAVVGPVDYFGLRMDVEATYELASLEGDRGTVKSSGTFDVEPQTLLGSTEPSASLHGHGSSEMSFDLARMVATVRLDLEADQTPAGATPKNALVTRQILHVTLKTP